MSADQTKLEEASNDIESDDTNPELEDAGAGGTHLSSGGMRDHESKGKQFRVEMKARKIMAKLDLKPVQDISCVTIRKSKNILFEAGPRLRISHSRRYREV